MSHKAGAYIILETSVIQARSELEFLFIGFLFWFFSFHPRESKLCTVNEDMPMRYRPIVS